MITVKYNNLGFRQEEGFTDWDLAVAGDSFTEMGILPYHQVPTTVLGKILNLRVANFGVAVTGPLTHLSYLRAFGIAPSTRRVMIIFFEGNDLFDLDTEFIALENFRKNKRRPYRRFKKQSSMIKAIMAPFNRPQTKESGDRITATFKSSVNDIPISLDYLPPGAKDLSPLTFQELNYFFAQYAEFAREKGVEAWLVYMPCKIRAVYGQIEFLANAPNEQREWQPTDLPETIAALSRDHGIRFINVSPALIGASKNGRTLLYNPFYDTHVNAAGAQVIAEEIVRHLK